MGKGFFGCVFVVIVFAMYDVPFLFFSFFLFRGGREIMYFAQEHDIFLCFFVLADFLN